MSEFNEFEPSLKSAINQFQLSGGLKIEAMNTILSGTNHAYLSRGSNSFGLKSFYQNVSMSAHALKQGSINWLDLQKKNGQKENKMTK